MILTRTSYRQPQRRFPRIHSTRSLNSEPRPRNSDYECKKCNKKGSHFTRNCPIIKCNRYGNEGHIGAYCNNKTYLSLRTLQYGCNKLDITGSGYDTHCCICKQVTPLTQMEPSDNKIRARCDKCAQSMNTLTESKRDSNTQPELMSPKSDKILRLTPMEEIEEDQEDPMEDMDLDGKGSTSYAEIVSRSIVPEITVTEEQLIKPKKYFINICEKCNRQGKGMNLKNLLRYHKYWNQIGRAHV